jgi:hypothetical protein
MARITKSRRLSFKGSVFSQGLWHLNISKDIDCSIPDSIAKTAREKKGELSGAYWDNKE